MSELGTPSRPLRVAVVGAGPAGFYTTEALLRTERAVRVDLIDRLPTPYGLVRAGVAPDVSRVLAKTVDELKSTDIADYALEALSRSKIREIHLVGRRGPAQAKFTPPEIREIGELADCDPIVQPEDLMLNPESEAEIADPENRHARDNLTILREFASRGAPGKRR